MASPPSSSPETEVLQNEETRTSTTFLKQLHDIMNKNVEHLIMDSLQKDDIDKQCLDNDEVVEESQGSSGHESGTEVSDHTDENPTDESQERSEKGRSPVKVQFSGMEGPSPPPGLNLEHASRSELISKLGGLQERLTQTQVDLKQEKTKCRKKEKNLFKMAKELSKRQIDTAQKEEAIVQVSLRPKNRKHLPLSFIRTFLMSKSVIRLIS